MGLFSGIKKVVGKVSSIAAPFVITLSPTLVLPLFPLGFRPDILCLMPLASIARLLFSHWLLPLLYYFLRCFLYLAVPVTLTLFAAPLCVFILGILLSSFQKYLFVSFW